MLVVWFVEFLWKKKLLPLLYASATRLDSIPRAQIVTLVPIQTASICVPMYALTTLQLIDKVEDGVEQNYLERFQSQGVFLVLCTFL